MSFFPPCFAWIGWRHPRPSEKADVADADDDVDVGVYRSVKRRVTNRKRFTNAGLDLSLLRLNYHPSRPFNKQYKTLEKIGAGAFGSVYKVRQTTSGQIRAMKLLDKKAEVSEDMVFVITEIEAMVRLDHPNVVKFYQFFEDADSIYLVSELCSGGDFSQFQRGKYDMAEVKMLFQDVFRGVAYCHDQGVAHRDIKFENCLLSQGQHRRVGKVIDFGLSAIKNDGDSEEYMEAALGTKYFVAPEVIEKKKYGVKCDIWSLGVMLYIILTKEHPFAEGATKLATRALFKLICNEKLRMQPLDKAHADPMVVALLKGLLQRDVSQRLDAASALEKKWLQSSSPTNLPSLSTENAMLQRVLTFKNMSRFEKTVFMMVAHQTEQKLVEDLHAVFVALDTHADGSLSIAELKKGLEQCGNQLADSELAIYFDSVDVNHSGKIDYSEWLSATLAPSRLGVDAAIRELFQFFDADGNGSVDVSELRDVVGDSEAGRVIHESDTSHDGVLDMDEFKALMHKVAEHRRAQEDTSQRSPSSLR